MNELLSKLQRCGIVWIAAVLLTQMTAAAQSVLLTGKVVDTDGAPVIGAGIISMQKKTTGTTSDLDGKFSFKVPDGTESVLFSSVGMKDVVYKIVPGKTDGITVVMEWESTQLDQVVVTGYAQTTVKRITGSVAVINSDKFEAKAISSVDALMQGEVAGVAVSATSGQPGTQSRIRIRGANNLSGTSQPLWVVDGVPMQSDSPSLSSEQLATGGFDDIFVNGIGNINPNDIESITILKDAAAAAIYGSRAANGVIVVTTKKGEAGRMRINYNNTFTLSIKPQRTLNLMNSAEKLAWEDELWNEFSASKYEESLTDNTVVYPVVGIVGQIRAGLGGFTKLKGDTAAHDAYIASLRENDTNWYNLLFRNAFSQGHHLSLSGGSDKNTYYVALGVNDEDGMLIHNSYRRYNVNSKMTLKPVDWVRIDIGMEAARQESRMPYSSVNPFNLVHPRVLQRTRSRTGDAEERIQPPPRAGLKLQLHKKHERNVQDAGGSQDSGASALRRAGVIFIRKQLHRQGRGQGHLYGLPGQARKRRPLADKSLRKHLPEQDRQEQLCSPWAFRFQQDLR